MQKDTEPEERKNYLVSGCINIEYSRRNALMHIKSCRYRGKPSQEKSKAAAVDPCHTALLLHLCGGICVLCVPCNITLPIWSICWLKLLGHSFGAPSSPPRISPLSLGLHRATSHTTTSHTIPTHIPHQNPTSRTVGQEGRTSAASQWHPTAQCGLRHVFNG